MHAILSLGLGYLIGSISPAALLGKIRNVNLKEEGTKNLGATNTMLLLGRSAGVLVMVFDIFKSFLSAKLARLLFPQLMVAGMIACIGAILGHCFPLFLHFQGGKGLAAFGGMVLAYEPWFFVAIVIPGLILMGIFNTGVCMPMLASVMFPVLVWLRSGDRVQTAMAVIAGILIAAMHWSNLQKARQKQDVVKVKEFFRNIVFKKQGNE